MLEEIKLEPSEELAYWTGVAQTDGYYDRTTPTKRIAVGVHEKSLPMLMKFYKISKFLFKKDFKTPFKTKDGRYFYYLYLTRRLKSISKLAIDFSDPPKPPKWLFDRSEFFGAYLAGVIDGDGDVRIKRPKYPQCAIRVSSGSPQIELQSAIKTTLHCGVSIRKVIFKPHIIEKSRIIEGSAYYLEFLISSKTLHFIKDFLLPWIQILHKREKIKSFLILNQIKN